MSKPQFGEPCYLADQPYSASHGLEWEITSEPEGHGIWLGHFQDARVAARMRDCYNACAGLAGEELKRVRAVNEMYGALKGYSGIYWSNGSAHNQPVCDCVVCKGERAIALAEGKGGGE